MRAALGEVGFAAAWAEGRALPLDEAVALALAQASATTRAPAWLRGSGAQGQASSCALPPALFTLVLALSGAVPAAYSALDKYPQTPISCKLQPLSDPRRGKPADER
jgi:hypothetical protein